MNIDVKQGQVGQEVGDVITIGQRAGILSSGEAWP